MPSRASTSSPSSESREVRSSFRQDGAGLIGEDVAVGRGPPGVEIPGRADRCRWVFRTMNSFKMSIWMVPVKCARGTRLAI
jgi:hypothetical protein